MRYLVEVPAVFSLEVLASSVDQANTIADVEINRLVDVMGGLAEEGSPDECLSFHTHVLSQRMIYPEKPQGKPS